MRLKINLLLSIFILICFIQINEVQARFKNKIFKIQECAQDCHQKVFVLSLDGGGIRGVILAYILQHIEGIMNVPMHQLFNLIAGTSTGGLVALSLSMPDGEDPTKARFTPEMVLQNYLTKKNDIFKKRSIVYLPGIRNSEYDPKGIETFCKEIFTKKMKFSELLIPAFVTTFNDTENTLDIFGSHSAFLGDTSNQFIWKAARMTSAAPLYFTAVLEQEKVYRDGGLGANNPSEIALGEIKRLFPNKALEDIIIVSIGTGENKGEKLKIDLDVFDIKKIIKQFEQAQLAAVDRIMQQTLGDNYIRIQTLLMDDLKTDDISDGYIGHLLDSAQQTIDKNVVQFERLKSLWNTQYEQTESYKHSSSYDDWRKIQLDVMHESSMKSIHLTKIQNWYKKISFDNAS